MIRWLYAVLLLIAAMALGACGGGGGGGTPQTFEVTGGVLWLPTGAPPVPGATVQAGTASAQTGGDGGFVLEVPARTDSLLVVYQPPTGSAVSFRFPIPAVSEDTDVGDLVIGPEKITVTGRIVDLDTGSPVPGASVSLAGRSAVSDDGGIFTLTEVAYDSSSPDSFLGLVGEISKSDYVARSFSPETTASGGVANLGDISIVSLASDTPPPTPFNIEGFVLPASDAPGSVAVLLQDGAPIRQMTVSQGRFQFFVPAGSYVLRVSNPTNGKSAPDETIVLAQANQVVRRDVTLR